MVLLYVKKSENICFLLLLWLVHVHIFLLNTHENLVNMHVCTYNMHLSLLVRKCAPIRWCVLNREWKVWPHPLSACSRARAQGQQVIDSVISWDALVYSYDQKPSLVENPWSQVGETHFKESDCPWPNGKHHGIEYRYPCVADINLKLIWEQIPYSPKNKALPSLTSK